MPLSPSPVKKSLLITFAVVLAPVLLVGLVAQAAGEWRTIGATAGGDQVSGVSSVTARKNGLRMAWVRVQYKEPPTGAGRAVRGIARAGSV